MRHVYKDRPVNIIFMVLVSKSLATISGEQDLFPGAEEATAL